MLITADRYFYSYGLWRRAADTGADLLWRVQSTIPLPVLLTLPDGSYLSLAFHPRLVPHHRQAFIKAGPAAVTQPAQASVVRVVEYDIPNRDGNTELPGGSRTVSFGFSGCLVLVDPVGFYLIWSAIAQCRMTPDLIVAQLDITGDILTGIFSGEIVHAVDTLVLEGSVE